MAWASPSRRERPGSGRRQGGSAEQGADKDIDRFPANDPQAPHVPDSDKARSAAVS